MMVYVILYGYGIIGIALVVSSSTILSSIPIVRFAYKIEKGLSIAPSYFQWNCMKELFGYSIFAFFGRIGDLLKYSVDSYVIAKFINLAAVTHYGIALSLNQYFIQVVSAFGSVVSPIFSQEGKGDFDSLRKKFMFTTRICSFVSFFIGVMILLYGKPFIQRWMGNEYLDAYPVLILLTVPIMFGLSQTPLFGALYGISKHYIITYVNIAEGLSNLVLSIILVKDYGIIGVAIGTAIPMTITTTMVYSNLQSPRIIFEGILWGTLKVFHRRHLSIAHLVLAEKSNHAILSNHCCFLRYNLSSIGR
jgi:O-antigen/teichoic acid export membrane protein